MDKGTPHSKAAVVTTIVGLGATVSSARERQRREYRAEAAVSARYGQGCEKPQRKPRQRKGSQLTPELRSLSKKDRRAVGLGVMRFFRGIVKMQRAEERKAKRKAERKAQRAAKAAYRKRQAQREARARRRSLDKLRKSGEMRRIRDRMAERFPGCVLWLRDGQQIPKGTPWWQPVRWLGNSHAGPRPESTATPDEGDKQQKQWAVKRFRECFEAGMRERRARRFADSVRTGYSREVPVVEVPCCHNGKWYNIAGSELAIELEEQAAYGDETQREQVAAVTFGHNAVIIPTHASMLAGRAGWQPSVTKRDDVVSSGCGVEPSPIREPETRTVGDCVLPSQGGTVLF
jgi:hypothetical protein